MVFTRLELTYTDIATLKSKVTQVMLCKTSLSQVTLKASVQG